MNASHSQGLFVGALKRRYGHTAGGAIAAGDRVKITHQDRPRRGEVVAVEGDTLRIRLDPIDAPAPADEIEEEEIAAETEPVVEVPMGHARRLIKRRRSA